MVQSSGTLHKYVSDQLFRIHRLLIQLQKEFVDATCYESCAVVAASQQTHFTQHNQVVKKSLRDSTAVSLVQFCPTISNKVCKVSRMDFPMYASGWKGSLFKHTSITSTFCVSRLAQGIVPVS